MSHAQNYELLLQSNDQYDNYNVRLTSRLPIVVFPLSV